VIVTTATSINDIGTRIANRLTQSIGPKRFAMWFGHSARFELDDRAKALRVTLANKFLADGIGRQFQPQLCRAARDELGHDVGLSLAVNPDRPQTDPRIDPRIDPRTNPGADLRTTPATAHAPSGFTGPTPQGASPLTQARHAVKRWRHSLDEFVVGPCNELAFAAAVRLAENDADPGSPLFIHGGCGLGKTHLLQGICRRVSERQPDRRVRYTTGEQFTNEYITAVRGNTLDAFRRKIRRLDLLAVDDVHFLANKEKTQQEFLHCFNEIELCGARVVMVSDSHPKLIKQFSDALASRCVRGMVVRIDAPDAETRLRLVEALAERRGLAVSQTAAQTIAQRCDGSVRDIEGMLNKLQAISMISRPVQRTIPGSQVIGHGLVDRLFQEQPDPRPRKPIRYDAVLDTVCRFFALPPEQVTGRLRRSHVVFARSLMIHLAYELTPMSYPEIAAAMGRPNHSTIVTAAQRIKKQLRADKPVLIPGQAAEVSPSQLLDQLRRQIVSH
jgi:chromosomal replication initiator protein